MEIKGYCDDFIEFISFRKQSEEIFGKILKSDPATRTEEDVRLVVVGLGQTVSSFTGF